MTGATVGVFSEQACRWCLVGALTKVSFENSRMYYAACRRLQRLAEDVHLTEWNDYASTTHEKLQALLEKALAEIHVELGILPRC